MHGAKKLIQEILRVLENRQIIDITVVEKTIDNLVHTVLKKNKISLNVIDKNGHYNYIYNHSVNVCVLSIMIGLTLGYDNLRLKELGIGAILHDVGKVYIDKKLLDKPGKLTCEEFEQIKRHAEYGYEILSAYKDISSSSACIALQHHENWDGRGYPQGLIGKEIHEYARIVRVADVFDALVSERPYRPAYSFNQAVTIMRRMSNIYFEPRALHALLSNLSTNSVNRKANTNQIWIAN